MALKVAAAARTALVDFPARLRVAPWFAAVGRPLGETERADAAAYLAGLGFPGATMRAVGGWREAGEVIGAADWNRDWWRAEEQRRDRLLARAHESLGETTVLAALGDITLGLSQVVHGAALAAAPVGSDPELVHAAAGAATTASYQAALEVAAGDSGGPFTIKLRLFEAGRWPLSLDGARFNLF